MATRRVSGVSRGKTGANLRPVFPPDTPIPAGLHYFKSKLSCLEYPHGPSDCGAWGARYEGSLPGWWSGRPLLRDLHEAPRPHSRRDAARAQRRRRHVRLGRRPVRRDARQPGAQRPAERRWIRRHFAYWDDIAVIHQGVRTVSTGHGFCGIGRKRLLLLLQHRARELGVELRFQTDSRPPRNTGATTTSSSRATA